MTWNEPKPDTTKPGSTTGSVTVTYPDGSKDTVTVPVKVGTDAEAYDPIAKDDVSTETGGNVPDAKDVIENMGDLPDGTTAEWTKTPDTSKPGTSTGTVTVTYPDGSQDTVEVPVKVGTDAEAYDAIGQDIKVNRGSALPDASTEGTKVEWKTAPDTSEAGTKTGIVVVTYPDGSTDEVTINVKVGTDADLYDPEGKDITTPTGTKPNPSDAIGNIGALPEGTTIDWTKLPDLSKPGTSTGTVRVTYPDGSYEDITVSVTVKAPAKDGDDSKHNGLIINKTKKAAKLATTGSDIFAVLLATLGFMGIGLVSVLEHKRRNQK